MFSCQFVKLHLIATDACLLVNDAATAASSYDSSLSLVSQASSASVQQPQSNNLLSTPGSLLADSVLQQQQQRDQYNGLDFRIMMDSRCGNGGGPPVTITLVASSQQEKAAWCSDISQVIG